MIAHYREYNKLIKIMSDPLSRKDVVERMDKLSALIEAMGESAEGSATTSSAFSLPFTLHYPERIGRAFISYANGPQSPVEFHT